MNLFDLMAKITLDTSEYEKGLDKSEGQAESFGSKLKNGLGTAAKVSGIAIGAVATAAGSAYTAMVKGTKELATYGDNIDKMSQKLGLSKEAYQEWDYVLGQAGADIDSMSVGLKTLTNKLDDAKNGNKDAQEMFEKLGISMDDIGNMSREDLFAATITGFQSMADSTERAALANDLFGRSGQDLTPLFNSSIEETDELRKAAHDLGFVLSDDSVKAAADYNDALDTMQRTMGGLKNNILSEFLPGMTSVMDGLSRVFSGDQNSGVEMIETGISDTIQRISTGIPKVVKVGSQIIKGLLQAISQNLPLLLKEGAAILKELSIGIIKALPELIKTGLQIIVELANSLVEALPELIPTIVEVIMSIVEILTDPNTLVSLLDAAISIILALAEGLISAVPTLIEKAPEIIANLVTALVKAAPKLLEAGKTLLITVLNGISSIYTSLISAGMNIVSKVKTGISSAWSSLKTFVTDKFNDLKSKIITPFETAKTKVKGIVDSIKNFFNFTAKTPKIKLPHFTITPKGWKIADLLQGVKPTLSISWYKKAYDNPYLFTQPTVVGNRGFGDGQGGEIVYGHENLMDDIRAASADNEKLDAIIALLQDIVQNGLNANIGKNQLYKTMADMNRSRTYATGYNGFAGV